MVAHSDANMTAEGCLSGVDAKVCQEHAGTFATLA